MRGATGWMGALSTLLAMTAMAVPDTVITTREALMRSGPGAFHPLVSRVAPETSVLITERQAAWLHGRLETAQGWLPAAAFEPLEPGRDYAGLLQAGEAVLISTVDVAAATKGAFESAYAEQHTVSFDVVDRLDEMSVDPDNVREIRRSLTPVPVAWQRIPARPFDNAVVLDAGAEDLLGRSLAAHLTVPGLLPAPDVLHYVNEVAAVVGAATPRYDLHWRVAVVDDQAINGYGLPGGLIVITAGLLRTMQDEAELACLLGHEMAHVCRYHGVREFQKRDLHRRRDDAFAELDRLTGNEEAKAIADDLGRLAERAYLTIIGARAREDEFEADLHGVAYAAAAGYDPTAMLDLLARIGIETTVKDPFRHHPPIGQRTSALRDGIRRARLDDRRQLRHAERFMARTGRPVLDAEP